MNEITKSTNVDNGKKEDLENMIDENVGVCCIGFQKGPEMTILPAEPIEPDYVFQAILDELKTKSPNESEVAIQLVIPEEYEKVKAQMKAKQAAQEKALFGEEKSNSNKEEEQTK